MLHFYQIFQNNSFMNSLNYDIVNYRFLMQELHHLTYFNCLKYHSNDHLKYYVTENFQDSYQETRLFYSIKIIVIHRLTSINMKIFNVIQINRINCFWFWLFRFLFRRWRSRIWFSNFRMVHFIMN